MTDERRAELERVLACLKEYKTSGDEHALDYAFSASKAVLARTPPEDVLYAPALSVTSQSFFSLFQLAGNFAALDGALTVMGRLSRLPEGPSYGLPARISVRNDQWADTIVTRAITDERWTILHPDGRTSYLQKDWSRWAGEGWPMGWEIERPDGVKIPFDENHFGDGWTVADMAMEHDDSTPMQDAATAAQDVQEELTGFATIGQTRYSYTATPDGFEYEATEAPRQKLFGRKTDTGGCVSADQVAVLRVMPMDEHQAFVMFAGGMEAEDVFLSMSFWGEDATERAAEVGFMLGARVLKGE